MSSVRRVCIGGFLLACGVFFGAADADDIVLTPTQKVAQRLMLDLRYFCGNESREECQTPLQTLPPQWASLIAQSGIGGVILFSSNIATLEQTEALVRQLQRAALSGPLRQPLLIAIDQEGGRVSRLPANESVAFPGNMALGALAPREREKVARAVGFATAENLRALGVHINLAPTVDVNSNPANPVINVRSFGDDGERVAAQAIAFVRGLHANHIAATIKHFPGHGDTAIDSHTGLPRVEHTLAQMEARDLLPFRRAIAARAAPLVMTAHIQFPALDSNLLSNKYGEKVMVPATLSAPMIRGLLRQEMRYDGVVVSDALDMAAIQSQWESDVALQYAFEAGVDIALMPFRVRSLQDIELFGVWLARVAAQHETAIASPLWQQSTERIARLREQFHLTRDDFNDDGRWRLASTLTPAKQQQQRRQQRALAQQIADDSITVVSETFTPLTTQEWSSLSVLMPDQEKCAAWHNSVKKLSLPVAPCWSLLTLDEDTLQQQVQQAKRLIIASISPAPSLAELGSLDDLNRFHSAQAVQQQLFERWQRVLQFSQVHDIPLIAVSLRAPYELADPRLHRAVRIATYHYDTYRDENGDVHGSAFMALAKLLAGEINARGHLPVALASSAIGSRDR